MNSVAFVKCLIGWKYLIKLLYIMMFHKLLRLLGSTTSHMDNNRILANSSTNRWNKLRKTSNQYQVNLTIMNKRLELGIYLINELVYISLASDLYARTTIL